MKLSARNQFKGKIVDIQEGAVNGIVKIDIGGGNIMSATISMNAIKELELAVGKEAYAVVYNFAVLSIWLYEPTGEDQGARKIHGQTFVPLCDALSH